ncbi:hypothetical protein Tco_0757612 [Tanacetum coccineum]
MILANRSQNSGVDAAKIMSSTYICTSSSSLPSLWMNRVGSIEPFEKSLDIRMKTNIIPRRERCFTHKELAISELRDYAGSEGPQSSHGAFDRSTWVAYEAGGANAETEIRIASSLAIGAKDSSKSIPSS